MDNRGATLLTLVSTIQTELPLVASLLASLIAVLFSVASYLAQIARQRTESLHQMNIDLKKEIVDREEAELQKQN